MDSITKLEDIIYVGCDDKDLDLFESQYIVPNGMAYNSYIILDEKIAIMDTIDKRKEKEWLENIQNVLQDKTPDYLVISHLEPDHSSGIESLCKLYPDMKLVGNDKTFNMLPQFIRIESIDERKIVVKEKDTLNLGNHVLQFYMAPMVHWPEVMVTYDIKDKVLFSADAFGKFGTLDTDEDWACEARRYYFNIVGKYGMQVQMLLKKLANVDIEKILPLHGPILTENLEYYISKYDIWSSYTPEDKGVFIACASIHGNTYDAAKFLKEVLEKNTDEKIVLSDLSREDIAECIEDAFRYDKMIVMASSYNAKVFPVMEEFLTKLQDKNYQKRKVGIVQNGSWAPSAAKCMSEIISKMKDIKVIEPVVTIKTKMNNESKQMLNELATNILK